ncbi:alternative ribosome rescue aminoacyl-tRNA hydrolase ArfB [Pseudofulvibacter geojedonensis]|uniref:Alternative ribosome rescue aminoacyl-tRNA hydrolase ArfB n=1 Tax=Pseudofulvibacter geojedonensis TaxID=1123758 RepID=A0ABW3I2B4_9FLAO
MDKSIIVSECVFKAVRSSGAGGQHVNKVSSKIELTFNVFNSLGLSESEKELLQTRLKLTKEGSLILTCSESRSQHKNKDLVIKRLFESLSNNLKVKKKRMATKRSKASILKRLKNKDHRKNIKNNRRKPDLE